jgi:hypothetical protein
LQDDIDASAMVEDGTIEVARGAIAEVPQRRDTWPQRRSGRNLARCQIGENKGPYRARHVSQSRRNDELI